MATTRIDTDGRSWIVDVRGRDCYVWPVDDPEARRLYMSCHGSDWTDRKAWHGAGYTHPALADLLDAAIVRLATGEV